MRTLVIAIGSIFSKASSMLHDGFYVNQQASIWLGIWLILMVVYCNPAIHWQSENWESVRTSMDSWLLLVHVQSNFWLYPGFDACSANILRSLPFTEKLSMPQQPFLVFFASLKSLRLLLRDTTISADHWRFTKSFSRDFESVGRFTNIIFNTTRVSKAHRVN